MAGGGTGALGDGGSATALSIGLGELKGIAVDTAGNLYATGSTYTANQMNRCVFRVSPSGRLTVVAGRGPGGHSGDGMPATMAELFTPCGVAVDSAGNLYITDANRIRRISLGGIITETPERHINEAIARLFKVMRRRRFFRWCLNRMFSPIVEEPRSGIITTVAGSLTNGPFGDGGPATNAQLSAPIGVAVDRVGNIYIADTGNLRIRKVSSDGTITTVAGNGTFRYSGDSGPATDAQLFLPRGVAVDDFGNIYIADAGNNRIRKVLPSGVILTVAGDGTFGYSGDGGPEISAQLQLDDRIASIAIDRFDNLYIADTGNLRIRKVSPDGLITTVAGGGPGGSGDGGLATDAQLDYSCGVAADGDGNIYIVELHRVRKVLANGTITTIAGGGLGGDGEPATSAQLSFTRALALDGGGNIYVAESYSPRIRKISSNGIITTVAGNGTAGSSGDGGPATEAQLTFPNALALDSSGNLYIADEGDNRIRKVLPSGVIITVAGDGTFGYSGDGGPATNAQLGAAGGKGPSGVAVDSAGNVYVADTGNNAIRLLQPMNSALCLGETDA